MRSREEIFAKLVEILFLVVCWSLFSGWLIYLLYKVSVKLEVFEPIETLKTTNPAMAFLEALIITSTVFLFVYLGTMLIIHVLED